MINFADIMNINSDIISVKEEMKKSYAETKVGINFIYNTHTLPKVLEAFNPEDLDFMLNNDDINIDIIMFQALLSCKNIEQLNKLKIVEAIFERINNNTESVVRALFDNSTYFSNIGKTINWNFWKPYFKSMFEKHQRSFNRSWCHIKSSKRKNARYYYLMFFNEFLSDSEIDNFIEYYLDVTHVNYYMNSSLFTENTRRIVKEKYAEKFNR